MSSHNNPPYQVSKQSQQANRTHSNSHNNNTTTSIMTPAAAATTTTTKSSSSSSSSSLTGGGGGGRMMLLETPRSAVLGGAGGFGGTPAATHHASMTSSSLMTSTCEEASIVAGLSHKYPIRSSPSALVASTPSIAAAGIASSYYNDYMIDPAAYTAAEYDSNNNKYDENITPRIWCDAHNRPITVGRWLQTKPLQCDLSKRPGPGNKQLTYLSGECVTRTLNQCFGFGGWNLQILNTERVVCEQQPSKQRWQVAYMAHVRITHAATASFREDVGAGDAVDRQLATAVQHALKASITDAMKRAARHFGEKLGNCLYDSKFQYSAAPKTAQQALEQLEVEHNKHFRMKNNETSIASVTMTTKTTGKVVKSAPPTATNSSNSSTSAVTNHVPRISSSSSTSMSASGTASGMNQNRHQGATLTQQSSRSFSQPSNMAVASAPQIITNVNSNSTPSTFHHHQQQHEQRLSNSVTKPQTKEDEQQSMNPPPSRRRSDPGHLSVPGSTTSSATTGATAHQNMPPPTAAQGLQNMFGSGVGGGSSSGSLNVLTTPLQNQSMTMQHQQQHHRTISSTPSSCGVTAVASGASTNKRSLSDAVAQVVPMTATTTGPLTKKPHINPYM